MAELLISKGAKVSLLARISGTPLHMAVIGRQQEMVGLLLSHGADVNETDHEGWTVLHLAVLSDDIDMSGLLIANGADVNAVLSDGFTRPLRIAIHRRNEAMIDLLRRNGAHE
jgi:ankyrin repeat protein